MKLSIQEERRYDVTTHKTLFRWEMTHLDKVCKVQARFDEIHEQDKLDEYRMTVVNAFKTMQQNIEENHKRNNFGGYND